MSRKFETSGPDGLCKLFGVGIFRYDWDDCHEISVVEDLYHGGEKAGSLYDEKEDVTHLKEQHS